MDRKSRYHLLVMCHKADEGIRNYSPYLPIQVGKILRPELELGFLTDDQGDNISERNAFWSEFTGIYWAWKNIDADILGVCHYRRYFKLDVSEEHVSKLLQKYDMIVIDGGKMLDRTSRARNLMSMTSQEDAYLFIDTVLSMHPEYYDAIYRYFYNSRFSYPYSMFIARKQMYDEFCEFVFPLLFEVEKRVRPHGYTRLKRTVGYFGEWSLGLFILCRQLKVHAVPLEQTDAKSASFPRKVYHVIDNQIKTIAYTIANRPPKRIVVPQAIKVGLKADGIELRALK